MFLCIPLYTIFISALNTNFLIYKLSFHSRVTRVWVVETRDGHLGFAVLQFKVSIYDIAFLIWSTGNFFWGNFASSSVCCDFCLLLKLFAINILTQHLYSVLCMLVVFRCRRKKIADRCRQGSFNFNFHLLPTAKLFAVNFKAIEVFCKVLWKHLKAFFWLVWNALRNFWRSFEAFKCF